LFEQGSCIVPGNQSLEKLMPRITMDEYFFLFTAAAMIC